MSVFRRKSDHQRITRVLRQQEELLREREIRVRVVAELLTLFKPQFLPPGEKK